LEKKKERKEKGDSRAAVIGINNRLAAEKKTILAQIRQNEVRRREEK